MKRFLKLAAYGSAAFLATLVVLGVMFSGDDEAAEPTTDAPAEVADAEAVEPTDEPKPTDEPTPVPDIDGAVAALKTFMDTFNNAAGASFYEGVRVFKANGGGGTHDCNFTVSDAWYSTPEHVKTRVIEQAAEQCAAVTVAHGLRGASEPSASNYPTTRLLSVSDVELAYKSTFRTKVIE